ncbi:hypothetical protein E3N88_30882 [Mikania micrantha]|uniref:RWP-RK domain-containing protein n=1 Tax=Mikania micrantha TaxID=192012 RepID=A0A5N6MNG4_9ASTR|nr:hypothetical protein E3N88_30882 [Mikania micrantha]
MTEPNQFPSFRLEDKSFYQGGSIDTVLPITKIYSRRKQGGTVVGNADDVALTKQMGFIMDIDAAIDGEVKEKIMKTISSILERFSTKGIIRRVFIQFWAATQCSKKVHLLTTTNQPFGLSGNNQELQAYGRGCLHHKLYVYKDTKEKEGTAIGLPALAFLQQAIRRTQDMHRYPKDQRPPCKDAIFERIWASSLVPIIDADKCFGVLEVITDNPNDSYDNDILAVSSALQHAGLQFSFQCNPPSDLKMKGGRERKRTTKTSEVTGYRCLVPYMGLKKETAAEKLGQASAANEAIKESTFNNLLKNVGMPEWPRVRNASARATSVLETQPESETSSSVTHADFTFISGQGFPELPHPGFMQEFDEIEYQNNNAYVLEYPDLMIDDELMNVDFMNANLMSNISWDEGNSAITSEIEASIVRREYGDMEDADIMNIDHNFMENEWLNELLYDGV